MRERAKSPPTGPPSGTETTELQDQETSFLAEINVRATLQTHVLDEILEQARSILRF